VLVYEGGTVRAVTADFRTNVLLVVPESEQLWIRTAHEMLLYSLDVLDMPTFSKSDAIAVLPEYVGLTFTHLTDRSDIGYFGTSGYGIIKINQRHLRIKHVFQGKSVYGVPFATDAGEIIVRNPMPYGVHYQPGSDPKFGFIARRLEDAAEAIVLRSAQSQYWLLVNDESITQIYSADPATQSLSLMAEFESTSPGYFAATTAKSGNVLIACHNILAMYDVRREALELHDMSEYSTGENGHYCMIETHPDEFWIGSPGGLVKAVLKDNQFEFTHFEEAGHTQNGLRNDHVAALLKDRNDASILWIGTKGGGLQKLDTRTMTFTNFNTQHGLPNDVIYGILDDDHGNLWLSSNKGITRFNPKSGQITNFVEADGLQSDEFNTFAYTKTPNGQMLFGGILGMNVFHPDDLLQNQSTGTPYLSDLYVNNTHISPGDSTGILDVALEYTGSITLPYSQNNITLHFVSTEYAAPFKNRFRHYLEGAEEAWTHERTDDHTAYLNLSPGRCTIQLMSSINVRVWCPATAVLESRITPPW
jgi:hypothetical protein